MLTEKLGQDECLRRATIQTFVTSGSFEDAQARFNRLNSLKTLTESDIPKIIEGFHKNRCLYDSYYLRNDNRFINFLAKITGKQYRIENDVIKESKKKTKDKEKVHF